MTKNVLQDAADHGVRRTIVTQHTADARLNNLAAGCSSDKKCDRPQKPNGLFRQDSSDTLLLLESSAPVQSSKRSPNREMPSKTQLCATHVLSHTFGFKKSPRNSMLLVENQNAKSVNRDLSHLEQLP